MKPREIFETYGAAVAHVAVRTSRGDEASGTAFHVGNGVFVTARHVVEHCEILRVATSLRRYVPDVNGNTILGLESIPHNPDGSLDIPLENRFRMIPAGLGELVSGPHFHPDPTIDVAALVVSGLEPPVVPLGSHLDDWINDEDFILREGVVMGYPPIPFSDRPSLVTARGEINAVIDQYSGGHPHFIASAMPRGGFSGAPFIVEWGFTLGVVTHSLTQNQAPTELGYMAILTVEPIFDCLSHHGIVPDEQKEGWDGFWDRDEVS